MPFAFGRDLRSIRQIGVVVDVPVADQLAEEHQLVGVLLGGTVRKKQFRIVGGHRGGTKEHHAKDEEISVLSHTTNSAKRPAVLLALSCAFRRSRRHLEADAGMSAKRTFCTAYECQSR